MFSNNQSDADARLIANRAEMKYEIIPNKLLPLLLYRK